MSEAETFTSNLVSSFWRPEAPVVLSMVLMLGLALAYLRPADRRTLFTTVGVFLVALLGQLAAAGLHAAGVTEIADSLRELFVLVGGLALIRLWGLLLFRVVVPWCRLSTPRILEDILLSVAYVAWGLIRLRYAGLDLGSLVTTSAVMTAVLAFSLQDTLGNILGGIALQLDDSVKVGDWIEVDDVKGRVVDIRWRFTAVESRDWETVVVPNSVLMKSKFKVLGRRLGEPSQWRRWVWFEVDFAIPPSHVIETVEAALGESRLPDIAAAPTPNCILMGFERGYGRYAVRYWLTDFQADDPTDSVVRVQVYAALKRIGVSIAIPRQEMHITQTDEEYEERLRGQEFERRRSALGQVDLFQELTEDEEHTVAERLVYCPFAPGEVITRQGAVASWLYILTSGRADVFLEVPNAPRKLVDHLEAGSLFGEMGLMTGSPRTATVIAASYVECYRLDKAAFEDVLHSRPAIAETISRVLASRRAALDLAQQMADADAAPSADSHQFGDILDRVRQFFGLRS